jgi:hypothetical protein
VVGIPVEELAKPHSRWIIYGLTPAGTFVVFALNRARQLLTFIPKRQQGP